MRFLVVRIAALGDVVLTTPLIERLRAEDREAHVTWLCGSRVEKLVRLIPGVDDVIALDEHALFRGGPAARTRVIAGVWRELWRRKVDVVLMLHPDPRYRVLIWPARGARIHAAKHGPGLGANPIPGRFRGDEAARLLDGPESNGPITQRYGLSDLRPHLGPSARSRPSTTPSAVLVPGGTRNVLREDSLRRWPVAHYRELARLLISKGVDVTLIGDGGDLEFGRQFEGLAVRNEIGKTSLTDLLQIMRGADVVVSHDTGPMHVARLVRTPLVALFGPTDPAQFIGQDDLVTVIWGGADLACRPCYDGRNFARCADNICINRIPVTVVLDAVLRRLAGRAAEVSSPGAR
jgi:heptosyltransferase-2